MPPLSLVSVAIRFGLGVAVVLTIPLDLAAQEVRGHVVERGTGVPIATAFITLVDDTGQGHVSTLTDAEGRFVLQTRRPGIFTLQVERIGLEPTFSPMFELGPGQIVTRTVEVAHQAIELEGIEVEAEGGVCSLPRDLASETYRLWDQARLALRIAVWADESVRPPYQAFLFERTRDLVTEEILEDGTHGLNLQSGTSRTPFYSQAVGILLAEGFVVREPPGGYRYFAPDAAVLLSDEFLAAHCFRARSPGTRGRGRIGLQFEPIPGHPVPSVRGTLWLDRETLELRTLEFEYTRHLHAVELPVGVFGGEMQFRRLGNGAWVVDRWVLRMPQFTGRGRGEPPSVLTAFPPARTERAVRARARAEGLEIREEGGELTFIPQLLPRGDAGSATLEGIVWDETRDRPLAGADVLLAGGAQAVRAGADGRFRMGNLPDGRHEIAFLHPRADELGGSPVPSPVTLTPGEVTSVVLSIPADAGCSTPEASQPLANLVGWVVHPRTGEPVAGIQVTATWDEGRWSLWEAIRGIPRPDVRTRVRSDRRGWYMICGVPVGERVTLNPQGGSAVEVEVIQDGLVRRDLIAGR